MNQANPLFSELESADLARRISDQILLAIGDGRLKPGEKVAEARLARELGTSRAPVREALRLLESQGLITSHPRRGFFVSTYEADDFDDIYDLRECLELHAAERAVERITEEDFGALSEQCELMKSLAGSGQFREQVDEDYAFHRMLCVLGGNKRIVTLFDQIATHLRAGITLVGRAYDDPVEIALSHDPILQALERRDPEQLRMELKEHLGDARYHFVTLFRGTQD